MEALSNLLLGVLSSFIGWWVLFRLYVPKISFSPDICKTPTDDSPSQAMFRVKVANSGYRTIVDVDIYARIFIKGLRPITPDNYTVVRLDVSSNKIPIIHKNRHKIVRIHPEETTAFKSSKYPAYIQEKAVKRSLLLEDLLALGAEAYLVVTVFGYDDFSGARKVFESKQYTLNDLKTGLFKKKSLEINVIKNWKPI